MKTFIIFITLITGQDDNIQVFPIDSMVECEIIVNRVRHINDGHTYVMCAKGNKRTDFII